MEDILKELAKLVRIGEACVEVPLSKIAAATRRPEAAVRSAIRGLEEKGLIGLLKMHDDGRIECVLNRML